MTGQHNRSERTRTIPCMHACINGACARAAMHPAVTMATIAACTCQVLPAFAHVRVPMCTLWMCPLVQAPSRTTQQQMLHPSLSLSHG